ncbi:AraC family transcriptional regulator [Nocardia stercoris]|uniref:AraC family transcriptional regulator n=1 Tax=Nocardia stercoris TaxID=2483361 RepID=A0A3M2LCW8_9NOCA|nr:AraC family transcriptional regulator [Nocardia stercoris]
MFVRGPITAAGYASTDGPRPLCAVARLRPGYGSAALGPADAAELVDRSVPLAEFWGDRADRLAAELSELWPDPARVAARLEDALLQRISSADGSTPYRALLDSAQHALTSDTGRGGVGAIARDLAISERHLRTLFHTEIGLSPKLFARIARVRRAARAATAGVALSDVARESGYYDQAHMTTDFRRIMGISPAAFVSGGRPAPRLCAGPPP